MTGTGPGEVARRAREGDAVALARSLVAIPSVNPRLEEGGAGEGALTRQVESWLRRWGFEVRRTEVAPGRFNLVGRLRGRRPGPVLLLNGHADTVGVQGMSVPPWEGSVSGGRLVGRGACDMKGGLGSLLSAAAAVARAGIGAGELVVAVTADEEHASLGMEALVASGLRADHAVVCEPTGLTVMPAHKGFVWFRVGFEGRAAHGSRPDRGVDAIVHAGLFLAELDELRRELEDGPSHPLLGRASLHAGTIQGGTAPSVYPASADLTVEWRTLPGDDPDEVEGRIRERLRRLRTRDSAIRPTLVRDLVRPGTELPDGAPLAAALRRALEGVGRPAPVRGMTAWVDAAFLNEAGIPALCFGPGSIEEAHAADESCPVEEIEACARVLEALAGELLEVSSGS